MKSERVFFSAAAALNLLLMLVGFSAFYSSGRGEGGRVIDSRIMTIVIVHGTAITVWYVLSLVQSLLITVGNRKLHMKLGWTAVGIVPILVVSSVWVAVQSVQVSPSPKFRFFGMAYSDFLLVMLTETVVFLLLVTVGILNRKRPEIHRAMMLSASLSLLMGATTRIPWLISPFGGDNSRMAFFGPVFLLGAILIAVRSLMTRKFARWLAAGHGLIVIVYLTAEQFSRTDGWRHLARTLTKIGT